MTKEDNLYYLYINTNDLNRFLTKNIIYPYTDDKVFERSLSLKVNNYLIVSTSKFKKETLNKYCKNGLNEPVVVQLGITLSDYRSIKLNKDTYAINDPISFNFVKGVLKVNGELPVLFYNDLYLFPSLTVNGPYRPGRATFDETILEGIEEGQNLNDIISLMSKTQAYYCMRYGYQKLEKVVKKKVTYKSNLTKKYFKEIAGMELEEFSNLYHGIPNKPKAIDKEPSLFDYDNSNDEEDTIIDLIYRAAKVSNADTFKDNLIQLDTDLHVKPYIERLDEANNEGIGTLKDAFKEITNKTIINLYILIRIIKMDAEEAMLYIENFYNKDDDDKFEIISMYGFINGMEKVNFTVKENASILLVAYNKAREILTQLELPMINKNQYFEDRGYVPTNLIGCGFDFKLFDKDKEVAYIEKYIKEKLGVEYDIPAACFSKNLFKFKDNKDIYNVFQIIKKEEKHNG